ncbi:DASS family sodium-coupled anion symporter [Methanococcoides orientis]|uniref:SLC13 family permease n=1 Tax=Methanococcoides orientis TaxID=2822137 RepID=UPI001E35C529|nr:DASS family sodium-coupled anion symporter [Methanococcoides orientis]UGV40309.1 DASS family sodium-coupled anion symporter [Methanococcoides orientis]
MANDKPNYWVILLSLIVLAAIYLLPAPDGLSIEGKNALGIFIAAIILWATSALPLSVTGLFVIALLPLLNVMSSKEAFSLFGNKAVFFILGAFILAAAMMKTGISKRIALLMLSRFDGTPRRLLCCIMLSSAMLSFIMPEHAVAAMMFPVVSAIADSLDLEPLNSKYGTLLFLSMAWGAIIGGVGTLLGGARNPLAIGLLEENVGLTITFFEWCVAIIPIVFVMLAVGFVVLNLFFRIDVDDVSSAKKVLERHLERMGKMDIHEKKTGMVLFLTVLAWIFLGNILGLAVIAIISAVSLFILNVIDWDDVESNVNWGIILMYGGAIAMGSALAKTGAAEWIANLVLENGHLTPLIMLLAISFVSIFLTECISNSAAVAILLPIGFSLGDVIGINPIAMVYMIAVPAGLAFILPMGTPPNAIAYSSGYYEIKDILLPGLILNLTSWIVFILMALTYWPLVGISLT